ncbi:MAG: substrate-binding domain-containing protein [Acidimicrobiales bacterium]
MPDNPQEDVSRERWELSRRRMLRNLGVAAAAVPFAGALTEMLTDMPANASPRERVAAGERLARNSVFESPFASHPAYKFTFVCHVTTNTFFTPTQYAFADAARMFGIPKPAWTGSINSIVSDMTTAIDTAVAANVKGIATCIIAPASFNAPVDRALSKGIPVVSYNADEPGNNRMAYIGQNNLTAGAAAAKRIVDSGYVKKGDLVGMIIATPGTGNIQPRIDGALPTFKAAGYDTVSVAGGALQNQEDAAVPAWYLGHKDVKFMYAVDDGDTIAVAQTISKYKLKGKVGGSGWDVGIPTLQQVQKGALLFSIDQQAYLQGFVPTVQLFLYNLSAGLMKPCDTDTGLGYVTTSTVGAYLSHKTRFEGSGTAQTAFAPPKKISY